MIAPLGEREPGRYPPLSMRFAHVATSASDEARKRRHERVDTHHHLLGLINEAPELFDDNNINSKHIKEAIESLVPNGTLAYEKLPYSTPNALKAITTSLEEAKSHDSNEVNPHDLFVALIKIEKGLAFGILDAMGITLKRAEEIAQKEREKLSEFTAS